MENATIHEYNDLLSFTRNQLNSSEINKSDAVVNIFFRAIDYWPDSNPADLLWFIISRLYKDPYNHPASEINRELEQSWKRTGGWALEKIFVEHYKDFLLQHDIVMDTFSKSKKEEYLDEMDLNFKVESAKADILFIDRSRNNDKCFGVGHVKTSIAERRQNDQNFSQELLKKNYFSPFLTLDCKSMPSEEPFNKGELGITLEESLEEYNKDRRIDKRIEFEDEGYFSGCFSYNKNTRPTPPDQNATARIHQLDFQSSEDAFSRATIASRNLRYGRT